MGQEAVCRCEFGDQVSEGKAHLDSKSLTFRGEFKLTVLLKEVASVEADRGRLKVSFPEGAVTLDLGPQADKWAVKIKHPKSLIDKLGVKPNARVAVLGVTDPDFRKALQEKTADLSEGKPKKESDFIFLAADDPQTLKELARLKGFLKPNGAIWVVSLKGKQARIKDVDVMAAAREAGLVDNKVAGFSETHTALKFVIPTEKRESPLRKSH
ncbi:MAG: DUF3052 family protein [Candidatus Manganitrophaceae bacterium]